MAVTQWVLAILLAASGWEYDGKGRFYYDPDTLERMQPEAFYDYGIALAREKEIDAAVEVFSLLAGHGPDAALREKAAFKKAEAYWSGGRYLEAHHAYASFAGQYPDTNRATNAKERAMYCALQFARRGDPQRVFGLVTIGHTASTGIELLKQSLSRWPRESFSADYNLKLGEFFLEQRKYAEAGQEFQHIVEEYKTDAPIQAARALRRHAEVKVLEFNGLDYDIKPLREAKRHFEQYLDEFGDKVGPKAVGEVHEEIRHIDEFLAQKLYRVAEYYESRGHASSARLYYETLGKVYKETEWAARAGRRLDELKKE